MNRIAMTVVALLAGVVVPAGALASHNEGGGQGSSRDFAVGTGQNEIGRVSFAAHGGPSLLGEPVTGHFHAKGATPLGPFNIDGPVTCLNVIGREAGLFYPVRDPEPPAEPSGVFIFLRDNGNPANGDPADQIGFVPLPVGEEIPEFPTCPPVPPAEVFEIEHGNFTIHDAGF
jgi:hypothetical protein